MGNCVLTVPSWTDQSRYHGGGRSVLGRQHELKLIDPLLTRCEDVAPGLLLRGEPGAGKTALLQAAVARAEAAGTRVLRASGVPFEAAIGLAALHQILYPLRGYAELLTPGHKAAVQRTL